MVSCFFCCSFQLFLHQVSVWLFTSPWRSMVILYSRSVSPCLTTHKAKYNQIRANFSLAWSAKVSVHGSEPKKLLNYRFVFAHHTTPNLATAQTWKSSALVDIISNFGRYRWSPKIVMIFENRPKVLIRLGDNWKYILGDLPQIDDQRLRFSDLGMVLVNFIVY